MAVRIWQGDGGEAADAGEARERAADVTPEAMGAVVTASCGAAHAPGPKKAGARGGCTALGDADPHLRVCAKLKGAGPMPSVPSPIRDPIPIQVVNQVDPTM